MDDIGARLPLSDKVVIVTGAGRGIGESCAVLISELGAKVFLIDIDGDVLENTAKRIRDKGGEVEVMVTDVSVVSQAQALVDSCVERFGGLDGLVNNAAIHSREWFTESEPAHIARMVSVNVLGVIYCSQAAARAMKSGGTLVNMTSGAQCGLSTQAVYSATKGAVASLTYSLALELKESGLRVNAISPLAQTRMASFTPEFSGSAAAISRVMPPPENNAALVAYLLSDLSEGMSGQVIRVDNEGISVMSHPAIIDESTRNGSGWSFDAVVRAFDEGLTTAFVPLGLVRTSLRSVD